MKGVFIHGRNKTDRSNLRYEGNKLKNTLAIASIIEILLEKNIITYSKIKNKAQELDEMAFMEANFQQNAQK